jgi:hypothetical protein
MEDPINKRNLYTLIRNINNQRRRGNISNNEANQQISAAANRFERSYENRLASMEGNPSFSGYNTSIKPKLKRSALNQSSKNNYFSEFATQPKMEQLSTSNYFSALAQQSPGNYFSARNITPQQGEGRTRHKKRTLTKRKALRKTLRNKRR